MTGAQSLDRSDEASNLLSWRPRVAHEAAPVDLDAAERAAGALLAALGLPVDDPGMAETPRRMATAYAEMLAARAFDFTTFPNTEGYDELVLVQHIPVRSVCEHHMLPFVGVAHVGYLPRDRILGLSKFARVVELFAHRPQTQERLTKQVAQLLQDRLAPRGVGVVVEAEHTCMTLRGVRAAGTRTVTSALLGALRENASSRAEFLSLTRTHLEV
ncbi:GTP cyclohydrolase I FolE [Cellulomonas sp. NTE-D12]|uniref:GTP cyclohydrolase I FolE n=1 Tax=Cellulomonas sp. NTE-D12 TaxID=2962632 RepID=UPI003081A7D4|nr:GTP cyclohydrolase 1 [Cellulomonas sp. NTE-D12]